MDKGHCPPAIGRQRATRWLIAALGLAACLGWSRGAWAETGLRWTGDARLAADDNGVVLGGASLRFRYGVGFWEPSDEQRGTDELIGSWVGLEAAAEQLTGTTAPHRLGTFAIVGVRPWLSAVQTDRFLAPERWSVLGVALPEVGVALGLPEGPRWVLEWDAAIGGRDFQIAPGVLWLSPGRSSQVLVTVAFRVPM